MSLIRVPSVRMIRQPPTAVPSPIATPHNATTQSGGAAPAGSEPTVMSVSVITPIVFCASLVPWASATVDADTTCPNLKPRVTFALLARAVSR